MWCINLGNCISQQTNSVEIRVVLGGYTTQIGKKAKFGNNLS